MEQQIQSINIIPNSGFFGVQEGIIYYCVKVFEMPDKLFCAFANPEFTMHILQAFGGA